MGFRFRKSISICPGVRLNLGKSGVSSLSVGPRGASVSIGKRGTHANLGLPGTGVSYRTRLDTPAQYDNFSSTTESQELIRQMENIENEMEGIINIHMDIPNLHNAISLDSLRLEYISIASKPFNLIAPIRPDKPIQPIKPELKQSWLGGFFSSDSSQELKEKEVDESISRWEIQNLKDQVNYEQQRSSWASEYAIWKRKKANYKVENINSEKKILQNFENDNTFFENKLGAALAKTAWPRETNISFEVESRNTIIKLAVDLPEIEDIPNTNYKLNKRNTEILKKTKSAKQLRLEYARLVHGILFRVAGIAFYNLPFKYIEICGFTQRLDKATGYVSDDYILDVSITREQFLAVNFESLHMIDPIDTLEIFQLNRSMTATGLFKSLYKK
jgi:hypothetical protein